MMVAYILGGIVLFLLWLIGFVIFKTNGEKQSK